MCPPLPCLSYPSDPCPAWLRGLGASGAAACPSCPSNTCWKGAQPFSPAPTLGRGLPTPGPTSHCSPPLPHTLLLPPIFIPTAGVCVLTLHSHTHAHPYILTHICSLVRSPTCTYTHAFLHTHIRTLSQHTFSHGSPTLAHTWMHVYSETWTYVHPTCTPLSQAQTQVCSLPRVYTLTHKSPAKPQAWHDPFFAAPTLCRVTVALKYWQLNSEDGISPASVSHGLN